MSVNAIYRLHAGKNVRQLLSDSLRWKKKENDYPPSESQKGEKRPSGTMDQVQVLSAVCKKLNNDIEALANQTSIRESSLAQLDSNQQAYDEQLRQLNMDLQIKLSKTDAVVQKLQSEVEQMSHGLRDVLNSQQETNRTGAQRYQELKLEV